MTYDETTLFRNFLRNKGILNNFEFFYQHHRFDKKSIVEFYDDTPAEQVIMTAFDFSKSQNTIFGYKYWDDLNTKWLKVLKSFYENNKKIDNTPLVRCGKCGKMLPETEFRVRKNGLLHKFCIACEGGKPLEKKDTKVCARCGEEKPLDEFYNQPSTRDGKASYCKECVKELSRETYYNKKEKQSNENNMEDYTFYDFDNSNQDSRIIAEGTAVIYYRTKNKYLIFGKTESEDILRSGLVKMRVRVDNITGAIHFLFNKDTGAASNTKSKNVRFTNSELVEFLMVQLGLERKEGSRYIISIGQNLSRTSDFITYKVSKY
jgi:hypothetical protein